MYWPVYSSNAARTRRRRQQRRRRRQRRALQQASLDVALQQGGHSWRVLGLRVECPRPQGRAGPCRAAHARGGPQASGGGQAANALHGGRSEVCSRRAGAPSPSRLSGASSAAHGSLERTQQAISCTCTKTIVCLHSSSSSRPPDPPGCRAHVAMLLNAWGTGLGAGLHAGSKALAGRTCQTVLQSLRRPPLLLWHAADRRPLHAAAAASSAADGASQDAHQQERQQPTAAAAAAAAGDAAAAVEPTPVCIATAALGQVGRRCWGVVEGTLLLAWPAGFVFS